MTEPVHSNSEELRRLYVVEGLTVEAMARWLGCGATTVIRRLAALGVPRRPRGPQPASRTDFAGWSAPLAYAVGLIATDGNLSPDGRHISLTSKDTDLLQTVKTILGLPNAITANSNGQGGFACRIQWGDRVMYQWLLSIGLMPAKSLRLGPLLIPDEFFRDFLRGCIDGDGSIITYTDRYNTVKNAKYVYERLFVILVSASRPFLEWSHDTVTRLIGLRGAVITRELKPLKHAISMLKYAKHDSIRLLNWLYYAPDVHCLARKKAIALPFLHRP